MLKNISYNNQKIIDEINDYVGKPYTILQRLKIGGIGSSKLIVNSADSIIENLLNLDNNLNYCNIEIRPKGIIIHFKSLLEIYGLIVPFYSAAHNARTGLIEFEMSMKRAVRPALYSPIRIID